MPASSIAGMNSWGLYLISAVALVLVLTPQLSGLVSSSREAADWRNLDGVRGVVDSLQPGVSVSLSFASGLTPDPVRLSGHQLSCNYGGGSLVLPSRWLLPNATLSPTSRYLLSLNGGHVTVKQVG